MLPEPWPEEGKRRVAADGSEYVERFRLVRTDMLEQSYVRQVRLEKWGAGKVVASQEATMHGDIYMKNEMVLMLRVVGFRQITVRGDYTDGPVTQDNKELDSGEIRSGRRLNIIPSGFLFSLRP